MKLPENVSESVRRWHAIEDGSQGKGTGRHIAAFVLYPPNAEVSDGGPLTPESPAAQSRRSLH